MKTFSDAIGIGQVTTAEALAIFDGLDTVEVDFMLGAWQGSGFPTAHPLDGALETYHWRGKRFEHPEHVHPLVFTTATGGTTSVNPLWALPLLGWIERVPIPKSEGVGRIFQRALGLFSTQQSCARLRLTHYRGKESATMVYDSLPINDIFRRVDEQTVLGLMDLKGMAQPFFFVLRREAAALGGDRAFS
ncbi:DUF4334 domain-containing protein [Nodosilinea sp. E11]|uniref:DUF4334 domain-containing protein n=1 Tax=Nodosilinea sp. E11 TaxID=3037479 RepID=UPI0029351F07|nr:DUF4334 domain-containing protein [Nodosilinea sp. E11]WOD41466.1 DUF4334 domain-containing protein [Nodosilinea sp. E11]